VGQGGEVHRHQGGLRRGRRGWAFWDNWSAKVEYDYYDFSTRNLTLPGTIFGLPEVVPGINVKETISTVKFGINYRFGAY
jgi:opacity protein-like surface antigen